MLIHDNSKLVMIGDSITDCGRKRPVGEGDGGNLGTGYVSMVSALIGATCPEKRIRVVNMGISGDTVRDLAARWQTDVLDLKPDWLSVMIGINDVWRQFSRPNVIESHVYPDEYEETLENLVKTTLPTLKGLVLMTPYIIESNKNDAMRQMMDRYGAIVKKIADKYGAVFVDIQAAFDRLLTRYYSAALALDRIHPNTIGQMLIAKEFLKAVGFKWE